jgi:hypothetical protein
MKTPASGRACLFPKLYRPPIKVQSQVAGVEAGAC